MQKTPAKRLNHPASPLHLFSSTSNLYIFAIVLSEDGVGLVQAKEERVSLETYRGRLIRES